MNANVTGQSDPQDMMPVAEPQAEPEVVPTPAESSAEAQPPEASAAPAAEDHTESAGEAPAGDNANWLAQDTSEQKGLKRGDVLEGKVTNTSPTAVYVDVGAKTDGIIPGRERTDEPRNAATCSKQEKRSASMWSILTTTMVT